MPMNRPNSKRISVRISTVPNASVPVDFLSIISFHFALALNKDSLRELHGKLSHFQRVTFSCEMKLS
jgi:hypothetical protein